MQKVRAKLGVLIGTQKCWSALQSANWHSVPTVGSSTYLAFWARFLVHFGSIFHSNEGSQ